MQRPLVVDGLWRCLCPAFRPNVSSKTLRAPFQQSVRTYQQPYTQGRKRRTDTKGLLANGKPRVTKAGEPPWRPKESRPEDYHHADEPTEQLYGRLHTYAAAGNFYEVKDAVQYLIQGRGEKLNARLYSAMILANVHPLHGHAGRVSSLLSEMENEGIEADAGVCHDVLQALAVHPNAILRSEVLEYMQERWLQLSEDGHAAVVAGLLRERSFEMALEKIEEMEKHGPGRVPTWLYDKATFMLLDVKEVEEAYQLTVRRRNLGNGDISPALWHMLLDVGSEAFHHELVKLVWAERVEPNFFIPSSGICSNVLNTAARHGDAHLATDVFRVMSNRKTIFSQLDYEMLLEAYITAGDLKTALTVLVVMEEAGVKADLNTANPIVAYLRQDPTRPMQAFNLLEEFAQSQRKVPTAAVNAIIQTCVAMPDLEQAIEVYKALHTISSKGPDIETFNTLFQGCRTARRKELAMFLAAEMIQLKIRPNLLTYDRLILVCTECGDIDDAFRYYYEMRDQGWQPRDGTFSLLIQINYTMASLLRQIVAGPRARHPEAGLDLCYVTDKIIATSGPSGTYPQRAYRNPLDALVKFLDYKHKDNWAIWEFRAEGTGYPDSEVYGRVYHYPFPDHHPPPFALIPHIMASMRNWLHGNEDRVVVVHCKAGKGRSGTASCSYLISEEGWKVEDALKRFTERRMRPGFGAGVSIPSQLRWVTYVDRWAKHGKVYVERQVEVLEVHVWGLRDGVKISVEGFVDEGKTIKTFHTFSSKERELVRGEIEQSAGLASVVAEVMGKGNGKDKKEKEKEKERKSSSALAEGNQKSNVQALRGAQTFPAGIDGQSSSSEDEKDAPREEDETETGGDVVFRPTKRVVLPTNDMNIDVERRNKAAYGLTMVTSVAHVWFNAYFEGNGCESGGKPEDSGVFEMHWDKMDGIKGSSRKGTRAFDRCAVVWKALPEEEQPPVESTDPSEGKDLGLRKETPMGSSSDVSTASNVKSQVGTVPAHDGQDDVHAGLRAHGPNGEEQIEEPSSADSASAPGPLPLSKDLPQPAAPPAESSAPASAVPRVQSPETINEPSTSITGVSTGDLPDGKPESELETPSGHSLGHLGLRSKD
ncbi:uncharacterized protein BDZ99DRAFT_505118 [Mytilinidion resinicola]|uniref:phosphatidylinositol-3,4,5-trisphosphate 3-phosphatase n=1 Tax=Mytilinidion resinicola TaxID=574789 RepID=A0A6A6Z9K5_9PEZI|nr:uncharacterized protein BDZ99DRAFT_505118 [Mytilinidion resinicola]KAF2817379.1 hypothetical protein BDZ99DRAFT_505118 [Mytilinidion resinicola]